MASTHNEVRKNISFIQRRIEETVEKTHLVMAESMKTNFSPSVPSSLRGTEAKKLRRSLFFSNGAATCIKRLTFSPPGTAVVRRQKSRKTRTNIVLTTVQIGSQEIRFLYLIVVRLGQFYITINPFYAYDSHPRSPADQQSNECKRQNGE